MFKLENYFYVISHLFLYEKTFLDTARPTQQSLTPNGELIELPPSHDTHTQPRHDTARRHEWRPHSPRPDPAS